MLQVIKATGEHEPFSQEKLEKSIIRAGIPEQLQGEVLSHVKSKLYDGITTAEVYKHILEFLGQSNMPYARAKYSLKHAIMDLGPTGYPFEDFVADILKSQGYITTVRNTLMGRCITHEVDVVAQKNLADGMQRIMVEAKFHNTPGTKTDVHVALYTKARFDDVKEKNQLTSAWIVTNTKITLDATTYALCNDVKVISWDYPNGQGLRDLVEKAKLIPITALATLSHAQKQLLLTNGVVACRDIVNNPASLSLLGLPKEKGNKILTEASMVI